VWCLTIYAAPGKTEHATGTQHPNKSPISRVVSWASHRIGVCRTKYTEMRPSVDAHVVVFEHSDFDAKFAMCRHN